MIVSLASSIAFFALATAHGDHGQSQLAGPHQGLWYNTLPGDGGTQVTKITTSRCRRENGLIHIIGGLCLFRDLNFRASSLLPMPV